MAKFNFRLQQILNIREQFERKKELEHADAIRKREIERRKLRELIAKKDEEIDSLREVVSTSIDPTTVRLHNNSIEGLKIKIVEQEARVAEADAFVEKKRQELVKAMQERKAMDNVRDSAFEEFTEEEKLAEARQVDELVSYKYAESIGN